MVLHSYSLGTVGEVGVGGERWGRGQTKCRMVHRAVPISRRHTNVCEASYLK